MFNIVASVAGGIGLFLLGMILMTDGLKALAGDALRGILSRYTTNRFSACAAGAGITALVQSSSATTVATIGFVSAGLLPFTNAVGVIIGANLGTTSTGWLVSLLGIKLSIGKLLLPLIGIGAFARLVFRGRLAQVGSTLAGFAVIFVGIDVLQAGMAGVAGHISPTDWPQATFGGRLLLVLIGMLMTIVMQSSSAAIATTLAALAGGAIDVPQAAALVIGQNIGTTVTAGVASIGGSVPAKRTAVAHVGFNVVTGVLAFLILPWFTWGVEQVAENGLGGDHALTIAAFHTAFNLLGVAIFLPLAPQYAHFIERRIKLKGPRLTQHLDPSLLQVPPVAIEAVRNVLKETAATLFDALHEQLRGEEGWFGGGELTEIDTALGESRRFLAKVSPPTTVGFEFSRQISTLHALDHLQRLANDMHEPESLRFARSHEALRPVCSELTAILQDLAAQLRDPATEPDAARVETFSRQLADERRTARPQILQATAARQIDAEAGLRQLRAQRWLDRIAYHIWRASHHLREMTRKEAAAAEAAGSGADSGQSPGAAQE
jgi:phosphate:Na+ symporter